MDGWESREGLCGLDSIGHGLAATVEGLAWPLCLNLEGGGEGVREDVKMGGRTVVQRLADHRGGGGARAWYRCVANQDS